MHLPGGVAVRRQQLPVAPSLRGGSPIPLGRLLVAGLALGAGAGRAHGQIPDTAYAVVTATLPLPSDLQLGATVGRFSPGGTLDTLRRGTNPMVCFADIPTDTILDVRCYHSSFVPLIYRARELYRSGLTDSAVDARMAAELRNGTLPLPAFPTTGYRVYGPLRDFNAVTHEMGPGLDRWQSIHMPFATRAALGVTDVEHGTDIYMMAEGSWWAHLMIMQKPLRY
jgi:hypothetical protein